MDRVEALKDFMLTASADVSIPTLLVNLSIAALLAFLLRLLYIRCGTSLSNRKMFASNFVLLACTTTLIIIIVKSSLALSLGLVGALSIVRFRSAIKEPEELAYLFLTIAIGLGMGADQRGITIAAFSLIAIFIGVGGWRRSSERAQHLFLTVSGSTEKPIELSQLVDALSANCQGLNLRRFEQQSDIFEAAFMVEFDSFQQLEASHKALKSVSDTLDVSFSDYRGVL